MEPRSTNSEDERAVSPVIGVILMVAITVILAAVIAAFVLDLGQSQSSIATAGAEFNEDGNDVTTTLTQIDNADKIYVLVDDGSDTYWVDPDGYRDSSDRTTVNGGDGNWEVGNSLTINAADPGNSDDLQQPATDWDDPLESITIIGELDGEDTAIQTWDN